MVLLNRIVSLPTYTVLHEKYSSKGTAPKVSKGRRLASGESAEGGSRKRSDDDRKALCSPPQRRNPFAAYKDMIIKIGMCI